MYEIVREYEIGIFKNEQIPILWIIIHGKLPIVLCLLLFDLNILFYVKYLCNYISTNKMCCNYPKFCSKYYL